MENPTKQMNSDLILISGPTFNVEAAKKGLADKVKMLKSREANKCVITFEVDSYHRSPMIIGSGGQVISKLRDDYDVHIGLSTNKDSHSETITITGLEVDAKAAKEEILKMVGVDQLKYNITRKSSKDREEDAQHTGLSVAPPDSWTQKCGFLRVWQEGQNTNLQILIK